MIDWYNQDLNDDTVSIKIKQGNKFIEGIMDSQKISLQVWNESMCIAALRKWKRLGQFPEDQLPVAKAYFDATALKSGVHKAWAEESMKNLRAAVYRHWVNIRMDQELMFAPPEKPKEIEELNAEFNDLQAIKDLLPEAFYNETLDAFKERVPAIIKDRFTPKPLDLFAKKKPLNLFGAKKN